MQGPFYFVVNPGAGSAKNKRLLPKLRHVLDDKGIEYRWSTAVKPGDATRLAKETPEGWTAVAVGDDDTLSETVAGLSPDRTVTLLPLGTSDFARATGISLRPPRALAQLLAGQVRPFDLPTVNGTPFLNSVGIGLVRHPAPKTASSSLIHLFDAARSVAWRKPFEVSVELDGKESTGKAFMLAIGNCSYYGGGLNLCPWARYDDGLLDICVGEDLSWAERLLALTRIVRGTHLRQRKFHYAKAHTVRVEGPGDIAVCADGRLLTHLPVEVRLSERTLSVLLPPGAWNPSKVTSIRRGRVSEGSLESSQ